jgi:hypothetical protein
LLISAEKPRNSAIFGDPLCTLGWRPTVETSLFCPRFSVAVHLAQSVPTPFYSLFSKS